MDEEVQQAQGLRSLPRPAVAAVALVLVVTTALRWHVESALWLDEALSVSIAGLPFDELRAALRRDGSPALYYVLLHGWSALWGTSDLAVRSLSAVFSLAALPLAYLVGARLRDPRTGLFAVLLLATSPFAVRYATEARMYALLQLLVLALLLLVLRAVERPSWRRLAPVTLVTGALLHTHYWSFFALGALGLLLLVKGRRSRPHLRAALAVAAGLLLLLPWLPTLVFQLQHTGTPWAATAGPGAALETVVEWAGGRNGAGTLLAVVLLGLALVALLGRTEGTALVLRGRVDPTARDLLWLSGGTLLVGILAGLVLSSGYAPRYSAVALPAGVLLAALGLRALPPRAQAWVLVLVVTLGVGGSFRGQLDRPRTQAAQVAEALGASARPGDLVVYCPDQLAPAVSRLLPAGIDQVVYPTMGPPARVDWVDYAQRNAAASPTAFAQQVLATTDAAVHLVSMSGYRTYGRQCQELGEALEAARGEATVAVRPQSRFFERATLASYPAATGT